MKVFLKFNRDTRSARICLDQWLKIFEGYDITIICDLFNLPEFNCKRIKDLKTKYKIINTNYNLGSKYQHCFGGKQSKQWERAGSANLTAYHEAQNSDYFWLIDADDTMFVSSNLNNIKERLKTVENYCIDNLLDGISLDFYREIVNDHWSFGVAFLKSNIDLSLMLSVDTVQAEQDTKVINMDSAFDWLRRKKLYNLESFVLNDTFFQHHVDRQKWLPFGLYYWNDGKLWNNVNLKPNVISF